MSASGEADGSPERQAFRGTEEAVGRLLREVTALRARLLEAEARVEALESGQPVQARGKGRPKGKREPGGGDRPANALMEENAELRRRLEEGRNGVERLLARIRFIEEQAS